MQIVAQSWLIYSLYQLRFMLGLNEVLAGLPGCLFSLLAGSQPTAWSAATSYILQYVQMTCASCSPWWPST